MNKAQVSGPLKANRSQPFNSYFQINGIDLEAIYDCINETDGAVDITWAYQDKDDEKSNNFTDGQVVAALTLYILRCRNIYDDLKWKE